MAESTFEVATRESITALEDRVKTLEDTVYPKTPPDFGPRLEKLERDLAELERTSAVRTDLRELEEKVTETIRIVAELRSLVSQLSAKRHIRTMSAGE